MKTTFQSRARTSLLIVLATLSLICFYDAIAIGDSRQTGQQSIDATPSFENERDRDNSERSLDSRQPAVSIEEFAKAQAAAALKVQQDTQEMLLGIRRTLVAAACSLTDGLLLQVWNSCSHRSSIFVEFFGADPVRGN